MCLLKHEVMTYLDIGTWVYRYVGSRQHQLKLKRAGILWNFLILIIQIFLNGLEREKARDNIPYHLEFHGYQISNLTEQTLKYLTYWYLSWSKPKCRINYHVTTDKPLANTSATLNTWLQTQGAVVGKHNSGRSGSN